MSESTTGIDIVPLPTGQDVLTEVLRSGARRLLAEAVEAEVAAWIDGHAHLKDGAGRQQVVSNGYLPERTIQTGIGPVEVRQPRVRDRRPAGQREAFTSAILPPYLRKTRSLEGLIPWLYLKGVSTGDFAEALRALLGPEAPGLSEERSRAVIGLAQQALAARPGSALERNTLAWSYLTAPEPLRDPARALELAQGAVRLEPANPMYRNTLGVAYYRAGRYREAIDLLRADLESQEDRFLSWDLCFLAMSYHHIGDQERARDYRDWALRWSRDQEGLSADHVHELTAIREEMEATLAR